MSSNEDQIGAVLAAAKAASVELASTPGEVRTAAIIAIADALIERQDEISAANELDLEAGREAQIGDALLDRLMLDSERIEGIADGARTVAGIEDPIGELLDEQELENGLRIRKVRRPLGVVCVVYEARPNVTIDAAVLCLRAGSAAVLRGSSMAARSNEVLARVASDAVVAAGLPAASVSLIGGGEREELERLGTAEGIVDLIVPRGGEGLKKALEAVATVPVIYAASGNCHIYVDSAADLEMAQRIVVNAKVQRPGVCNAAESLIVHEAVAAEFLPSVCAELAAAGVELRCDGRAAAAAGSQVSVVAATDEDFAKEFLAPIISIGVVDSLDSAIDHIAKNGSGHSEAIVTADAEAAARFQTRVDAAAVYWNASTRFTDGAEFGMGAGIGISTQKLHARGPIGVRELTTYTWLVQGDGQIRG